MRIILYATILLITSLSAYSAPRMGADRTDKILEAINGERVGLIVNHTSLLSGSRTHLLDTLVALGVDVRTVFAPEHGFRGTADAGEHVSNERDPKTGIPIISLYGKNYKPTPEQLADIDVLLFDIQDVGTRFYTYISTMFYAMESCRQHSKRMIVLDRPNPNDYIDGPIVEDSLKSFVGIVPIPLLHGLTVCELALMIRGEGWAGGRDIDLTVIPMTGWKHGIPYSLPVKPSPNLPNDKAIKLYPSLCVFEATGVSVGRGTTYPFQVLGYPDPSFGSFSFTPVSLEGFDKNPLQKDRRCYGVDLRSADISDGLTLRYIIDFYRKGGPEIITSDGGFDRLMGSSSVRLGIMAGLTEEQIRSNWHSDLIAYKKMRSKYLLYPDQPTQYKYQISRQVLPH